LSNQAKFKADNHSQGANLEAFGSLGSLGIETSLALGRQNAPNQDGCLIN